MKDKIIAAIKAKFPAVNLSKKRLDEIAAKLEGKVTDESEIDAKVEEFNSYNSIAEIAKTDDVIANLQSKLKPQPTPQPQPNPEPNPNDPPAPVDLAKMFQELKSELDTFKQKENRQRLQETFFVRAKEKNIPPAFLKGRSIDKEEDLDTVLAEVETDWTETKQALVNEGLGGQILPLGSEGRTDNVEADIKAWAGSKQ